MARGWAPALGGFLVAALLAFGAAEAPAQTATPLQAAAKVPDASTPILRIETGMHGADINRIALADQGRVLVTVSDDKTTRLWTLPDGAAQAVWRTPIGDGDSGALYAVATSGDTVVVGGRTDAAGAKGSSLYVFDRRSGQMRGNIGGFPEAISALAFSPDGHLLAVGQQGRGGLAVIDFAGRKMAGQDRSYGDTVEWIAYAGDGRLATSSADGKVRLYDAALKPLATTPLPGAAAGERPWGLAFSPDGKTLAVGSLGGTKVRLLSTDQLKPGKTLDGAPGTSGALSVVAWSPDGAVLAAAGSYKDRNEQRIVRFWRATAKDFAPGKDVVVARDTVTDLMFIAGGRAIYATAEPSFGVVDAAGNSSFRHGSDHADFRDAWQDAFRVSRDGAVVDFPGEQGGKGRFRFELLEGSLTVDSLVNDELKRPLLEDDRLKLTDWRNSASPKLNGRPIALEGSEHVRSIAVVPGSAAVALGSDFYLRLERADGEAWRRVIPAPAWAVNASGDGRYVVAALGDGTIRWYAVGDGREAMSLFVDPRDRRWVVWVPEGFFDHSHEPGHASGETLVGYHLNKGPAKPAEFVAIGQLYSTFYRRDLVLAKFRGGPGAERSLADTLTRTGNADAVLKTGLAPRAELIDACLRPVGVGACPDAPAKPADGSRRLALSGSGELVVRYRIEDRGGGLGRVIVRRNGAALDTNRAEVSADDQHREETVVIPLGPDKNEVRFSTESLNGTVQSAANEDLVVAVAPPPPPPPSAETPVVSANDPQLFVIAIGVSEYQQPEFRLANAANDASAVAELLKTPSPPVYASAEARTLIDGDATVANIEQALQDVAAKARPQDIVVVFLSGHGESVDGKYYYAPVDFATRHPDEIEEAKAADDTRQSEIIDGLFRQDGFGEAQLLPLLEKIQGNLLLVLDTCFSATLATSDTVATKARNETVARSVGHETGRFILAGARSLALDSAGDGDVNASKHGLFTANLLKGLNGAGDLQHVGRINVAELLMFTKAKVRDESKKLNLDQEPFYYFQGSNFFDVRAVAAATP